jgi:hypothetical protein
MLIGIFLCSGISYSSPNLRVPLLFNKKKSETYRFSEIFPKKIYLQNELTGENFELYRTSKKDAKRKEYILRIGGKKIKGSEFIFSEFSDKIYIHNIYVGYENYRYTSQGIGLTVLRYIARRCVNKGKNIEFSSTENYGLIRLCYKYLSAKTRYVVDNKELYFGDVDWLRDFGPIEISIIKKNGFEWCGQFLIEKNTDIMKFLKVIPYDSPHLRKFAEEIVVTNREGMVKITWKDLNKIDLEIKFQISIPVLIQGIKIDVEDLMLDSKNLILPSTQRLPSKASWRQL